MVILVVVVVVFVGPSESVEITTSSTRCLLYVNVESGVIIGTS